MLGFSSIGSVEGINAIMTGQLIKLSEQQLIDCINITHGAFEEGGLPANAFWYIKQNRGVVPAESYPYVARKCPCKIFEDYMVTIDGYQFVPQDENSLEKAVANQPVVVDVASGGAHGWMRNYKGGIADCHHETPYSELDHSMLAVAYGTEKSGRKYWVCKNSLGRTWGKKGYCHIAQAVGYKGGAFGIAKAACFPVKTSPNRRGSIKDEAMLIDQDSDK
ncbi:hypothetical protein VPH35_096193 [Triticum aestivum]|uniref:Thiol protease SEN102 n=1 Tax=Aegilops tauschii TaxID=37682 RepID=R7W4W9_AEGTA